MNLLGYRFALEREGSGRHAHLLLRCWGREYRDGEIAYATLGLTHPCIEVEWPSDWHEHRRVWVRLYALIGRICVSFPWRGKVGPDHHQCSGPTYGLSYADQALTISFGQRTGTSADRGRVYLWLRAPWAWEHVRHDYLSPDGSLSRRSQSYRDDCPQEWRETHLYTHRLRSGEQQQCQATIYRERREWRWRWFQWLPFPRKVHNSIRVAFDREMGERAGSWKGGTIGCGYDLRRGETPLDCLRRMEREREFS